MSARNAPLTPLCMLVLLACPLSAQIRSPALPQVHGNNLNIHRPPSRTNANQPVDMKSDPYFHVVLDNERVRVFTIDLPPLGSTQLDTHTHDYIILSLGKSSFQLGDGAHLYPMQLDDGEMQVMKGGWPHRATNLASTSLRLVEVEISRNIHPERPICGLAGRECVDGKFGGDAAGTFTHSTLFETDTVKLCRLLLNPGVTQPDEHHDRSHILLALDDLQLSDGDSGTQQIILKPGEARWYASSATHQLRNLEHVDARLVTIDLK